MTLDDLRLFASVARHGSYARAAEELGVGRSTLSRVVQRIEVEVGETLLHRTTRRVGLTGAGAALLERIRPGLEDLDSAIREVRVQRGEPSGRLCVTASSDMGVSLLAPAVALLSRRYPALRVEARLTLRAVDLVAEQVDVALRVYPGRPADHTLSGRHLGDLSFGWFATPSYLREYGTPRSEADLASHDLISVARAAPRARLQADDTFFGLALVRASAGIGFLPRQLCAEDVEIGALLRVLPSVSVLEGQIWLVYPEGSVSPNVAALRDALLEVLA